ncbi:hypothetical protein DFQ01_14714 [Paenibacillus cellulosilyticus]|uniref:Uncharacterized protein n=1 Tax=Paenibacillus cellulosilyticus TaxID=375489 RepID=A0A2V2YCA7_9BACL|nr:hypothetical protein DFQ01_14714 [Paenibacillus cellulosilyticus]
MPFINVLKRARSSRSVPTDTNRHLLHHESVIVVTGGDIDENKPAPA